jgi:hypothetical protein
LERPFEETRVSEVMKALNCDKASSPDGFTMGFFQACWEVLKANIMNVFHDFHARGMFEKSLNIIFISLIPKKPRAIDIKEFRPISLVGPYKIVAKVLANMLKMVVEKIISKPHNAFITGRQILDYILIANECLNSKIRPAEPSVLCKLDIEKAYDHVSWDFPLYLLRRCGFGGRLCKWIAYCISSMRFSVLVNSTSTDFFISSWGLRQGDHCLPFSLLLLWRHQVK